MNNECRSFYDNLFCFFIPANATPIRLSLRRNHFIVTNSFQQGLNLLKEKDGTISQIHAFNSCTSTIEIKLQQCYAGKMLDYKSWKIFHCLVSLPLGKE